MLLPAWYAVLAYLPVSNLIFTVLFPIACPSSYSALIFFHQNFFWFWNVHGTLSYMGQWQLLHYKAQGLHMCGSKVPHNYKLMCHNEHFIHWVSLKILEMDTRKSKPTFSPIDFNIVYLPRSASRVTADVSYYPSFSVITRPAFAELQNVNAFVF